MSLLVLAGIAGGVAVAAVAALGVRWVVRRRLPPAAPAPPALPAAPEAEAPAAPSFEAFGLNLGDVIMLRDGEAWLTGGLRLMDSGQDEVGLFFTDQTTEGEVLLVRPVPNRALFLVHAVDLPEAGLSPHSLEHERELFRRVRRIPVTLESQGEGCPAVSDAAEWSWFESPGGEVLVCLQSTTCRLAWRGRQVDEGSTLRLAAGQATFRNHF